jgi:Do/DeqQ family serine protease
MTVPRRAAWLRLVAAGAAGIWLTLAAPAQAQLAAGAGGTAKPTLAPLLRRVRPAVVNIAARSTVTGAPSPLLDDPFFRRFFDFPEQPPEARQSAGSGVIVDSERGYVLTNHHVVADAELITVNLADRRNLTAKLIGSDAETDIALLQIDAANLTALPFGDSATLEVGDFVLAIGNPFGLGQTVTSGIVSALGRTGLGIEGYEDFIQTDASINPGNSGGALVDLDGKLVGINAAILSATGGNIGIGFAVPSNMARAVMEQLLEHGEIRRGRLGITAQDLTPDLAAALRLPTTAGAIVNDVEPGSAAERAGIAVGNVITALNGGDVRSAADLRNGVGLLRAGETVALTGLREGRAITFETRIGESPRAAPVTPERDALAGAAFRELEPSDTQYGRVRGVVVARVDANSAAARAGLRASDVILGVNRTTVSTVEEFERALRATGMPFALQLARGGARLFIVVR